MPKIGPTEILLAVLSTVFLAIVVAIFMSWGWLIWRLLTGQPILPERPMLSRRETPWRGGTILVVFLVYVALSLLISYGYHVKRAHKPGVADDVPWAHMMQLNAVLEIVLLILVPVVVRMTCGARLRDFGLSKDGWWRQAFLGMVATLIAAPPVYAVQYGAALIWEPEAHPLIKMILEEFSLGVGGLAVVTAVFLAPMFEELAFRGLLQSWLVGVLDRDASPPAMILQEEAVCRPPTEQAPAAEVWDAELDHHTFSKVASSPLRPATETLGRRWLGIVLTSLLFAYVHAPQWPAPIALFALALVIGTVYYRTGSLIAAIFMHATFNGISTLMLFMAVLAGEKLGHDKMTTKLTVELRQPVEMGRQRVIDRSEIHGMWQKVKSHHFFLDVGETD
jgi:membrane protease YdiL (CAAX protease family)